MSLKSLAKPGSFVPIPTKTEEASKIIIEAAFKVHTALGPGLLESVYETCLAYELMIRNVKAETQVSLPVRYEGITVESGLRMDMLVDNCVIVEIKAVEKVIPLYKAQLLTYLKLANIRLGLLINFNEIHLRDGIARLVK